MLASIIMPAYNEEKTIGKILKKIPKKYEIIVVDDYSSDKTAEIAEKYCKTIRLEKNMGKGYACRLGAKHAKNENIVFFDTDGQFDAGEIENLVKELKNSDMVVGIRNKKNIPFAKRLSNGFARKMINSITGKKYSDVLCGFKAIKKDRFFSLDLKKNRYEFESEMMIKAKNFKIKEIPINVKYNKKGGMGLLQSLKVAWYLIKEYFR